MLPTKCFCLILSLIFSWGFCGNQLVLSQHRHGHIDIGQPQQFYLPTIGAPLADGESLVFVLTPFSGDADLFVSSTGNATGGTNEWKGEHAGADIVYVKRTDGRYTTGPYWITVKSLAHLWYTIIAYRTLGENIKLDIGRAQLSHADADATTYFKFNMDERVTFSVSTTPLHGDPDIYVSTTEQNPSQENYDWKSGNWGLDVMRIDPTDPKFKIGEYYVGVRGYHESLFSIVVSKNTTSEWLAEGIPHGRTIDTGKPVYFQYFLASFDSLHFEANPTREGDLIELCVSRVVEKPTNCQWLQYSFGGSTQLSIKKDSPNWGRGWYYISVFGFSNRASITFQINGATEKQTTLLLDGVLIRRGVYAGDYQFFRFYYGYASQNVTITSQSNIGSTNIYASRNPANTRPTREKHDLIGRKFGSTSELLLPFFTTLGWYYIGFESTSTSNYTIMATSAQRTAQLSLGRIQYGGSVPSQYYRYYVVDYSEMDLSKDLTIATHVYRGDVGIYASTLVSKPTFQNRQWNSGWSHGVVIRGVELERQVSKLLYIGVRGESIISGEFSVVAYSSNNPIILARGRNYNGVVLNDQYINFEVKIANPERVSVTLLVRNDREANAHMFVSFEPNPNSENYEWKSPEFGAKRVQIPYAYTNIYISVKGSLATAEFSLRVSHDYEYVDLGMNPILDDVEQGKFKFYQTSVFDEIDHLVIATTLISGHTHLYINTNSTIQPNITHHDIQVAGKPGNAMHIDKANPLFRAGPWAMSVYGVENSDFYISAVGDIGYLTHGEPVSGLTSSGHPAFYYVSMHPNKNQFFNLVTFDACAEIYVSQTSNKPSRENHKWSARSERFLNNQVHLGIPSSAIDQEKIWMTVGIYPCVYHASMKKDTEMVFQLTSSEEDSGNYLTQEIEYFFKGDEFNQKKPNNFFVQSSHHARGFRVYLQSCSLEHVRSKIALTSNTSVPFPIRGSERRSITHDRFTETIEYSGGEYQNKLLRFSVYTSFGTNLENDHFSLWTTLKDKDPRPQCTGSGIDTHYVSHDSAKGKSTISVDINRIQSDYYPLIIEIVYIEDPIMMLRDISHVNNFDTLCGIKGTERKHPSSYSIGAPEVTHILLEFEARKAYRINVIITDRLGRQSVCKTKNFFVDTISPPFVGLPISLGTIFLIVVVISMIAYLVVGTIWNKFVHKKNGWEIIPNFRFWADLPFLMWDGVVFVFTCGKRRSFVAMEEGEESVDSGETESPFSKTDSISAYGSL